MDAETGRAAAASLHREWAGLMNVGSITAWASLGFLLLLMALFLLWPPPLGQPVQAWMDAYLAGELVGLVNLDFGMVLMVLLQLPLMTALAVTLWPTDRSFVLLAGVLYLLAMAAYLPSNPSVEMLLLSRQYGDADPAQQERLLAAGQGLLARYTGTSYYVYYILSALMGKIFGLVQLRSSLYKDWTAWLLVIGSVLGLGLFLPVVGVFLSFLSMLILLVWFGRMGYRLQRLAQGLRSSDRSPRD